MFGKKKKEKPVSYTAGTAGDLYLDTTTNELLIDHTGTGAPAGSVLTTDGWANTTSGTITAGTGLDYSDFTTVSGGGGWSSSTDTIDLSLDDLLGGWSIALAGEGGLKLSTGKGADKKTFVIPGEKVLAILSSVASLVVYGEEDM